jgi:hypothetical protein
MKRQCCLVTLCLLLSLLSLPSTARGQQQAKFLADTGLIIPGPHQKLRLTVTALGNSGLTIRFRQMEYTQDSCDPNAVCKLSISSETTSAPISLAPGQVASLDLVATTYGRGNVLSNGQNARVTLQIIDTATEQVDAILIALLLP